MEKKNILKFYRKMTQVGCARINVVLDIDCNLLVADAQLVCVGQTLVENYHKSTL